MFWAWAEKRTQKFILSKVEQQYVQDTSVVFVDDTSSGIDAELRS